MIYINLQKWPQPNEEADFRFSETLLLDWGVQHGLAKLQGGRTKKSPSPSPPHPLAQDLIIYMQGPSANIVVVNVRELCEVVYREVGSALPCPNCRFKNWLQSIGTDPYKNCKI